MQKGKGIVQKGKGIVQKGKSIVQNGRVLCKMEEHWAKWKSIGQNGRALGKKEEVLCKKTNTSHCKHTIRTMTVQLSILQQPLSARLLTSMVSLATSSLRPP